jgi:hypothetical protein
MALGRRVHSAGLAVALVTAAVSLVAIVAPDAQWLAALGGQIIARGGIPDGVPFAAAPSSGWPNVPVLAELTFHGLQSAFGASGLSLAQVVAVGLGFGLLAFDAVRAGARRSLPLVLLLVALGSPLALIGIRVQLFSLVLFPALLLLLRSEARAPSRRVWVLVPLFALWSNLHGAALAGVAVAGAYLVVERGRREPLLAASVLGSSILALGLTPALLETYDYYHGVLENEAARQGFGLWASLSLHDSFDLLLLAVAVPLLLLAVVSRPRLWELVALAGLAALTVQTARGGVWLLFATVAPASRADAARRLPATVPLSLVLALGTVAAYGVVRGPLAAGAREELVNFSIARAGRGPVLADPLPAEQIALEGGRVWMSNPLDAFRPRDQRLYLDWLQGRPEGDAALSHVRVVLVLAGSDANKRMAKQESFRLARRDDQAVVYTKR